MAGNHLFLRFPYFLQDLLVTAYDIKSYATRRSGVYWEWRNQLSRWDAASPSEIAAESERRLSKFLAYATTHSRWYAPHAGKSLAEFPVLNKRDLVRNLDLITTTGNDRVRISSFTGGTSGASMKVYYLPADIQERSAFLDHFRCSAGYELGKSVAWFSGKDIATASDVCRGRCYRDDKKYRIRYFSTFHICKNSFRSYWDALQDFAPDYLVGFPSSLHAICAVANERGLRLTPAAKVFFPTAETMLPEYRKDISAALGCEIRDQYASSEGAPFIFECHAGRLHIHPFSGVFEVVDENLAPSVEGEILVTSFSTSGTPLIRYRIGDRIKLDSAKEQCACGSTHQLVERIDGRSADFVWSPSAGRINLGNISNCTKGVNGIVCFQVLQSSLDAVSVQVVSDERFDDVQRHVFLDALRQRMGPAMSISLLDVDEIPVEASGKFRIVKNQLPPEALPA